MKLITAMAAMMVMVMAAISCHKTDLATMAGQQGTRNAGAATRTFTGTDSATVVNDIKDFDAYAYARSQSQSGSQGGLSSTLSVDRANELMENTLNYYYGVLGDDCTESQLYTDSVAVRYNSSSTLDLSAVADGYNDALTQIKADYVAVGTQDGKRLEIVYSETVSAGTDVIFIFKYIISWNPVSSSWAPYSIDEPFGPSDHTDNLFWKDASGSCNTYVGTNGAPFYMRDKVRKYFNRFPGLGYAVFTSDRIIPIFPVTESNILGVSTTTSNPFAANNSGVVTNYWTHYQASGTTSQLNNVACIPDNGLNAYKTAIIGYIQARETALNMEFADVVYTGIQTGSQPATRKWSGDYTYAHFVSGDELRYLDQ